MLPVAADSFASLNEPKNVFARSADGRPAFGRHDQLIQPAVDQIEPPQPRAAETLLTSSSRPGLRIELDLVFLGRLAVHAGHAAVAQAIEQFFRIGVFDEIGRQVAVNQSVGFPVLRPLGDELVHFDIAQFSGRRGSGTFRFAGEGDRESALFRRERFEIACVGRQRGSGSRQNQANNANRNPHDGTPKNSRTINAKVRPPAAATLLVYSPLGPSETVVTGAFRVVRGRVDRDSVAEIRHGSGGLRLTRPLPRGMPSSVKYEPCLHIVLHQPEIPYNTGSVGRTCVAVGAKLWLVRPLGFRLDDYYLRRAGLDYWEHLEFEVVDDWAALTARLPPRKPWLLTKTATNIYTAPRYEPGDVFVFGSESQGLPPDACARASRANAANPDPPGSAQLELIEQRGDRGVRGAAAMATAVVPMCATGSASVFILDGAAGSDIGAGARDSGTRAASVIKSA